MLVQPMRWSRAVLLVVMIVGGWSAPLQAASHRETPLVKAIQRVRPSVVNIHSQKTAVAPDGGLSPLGAANYKMNGMGTGVVVDERGYIVTNYHVIEDVSSINVTLVDGTTHAADVVARDPETDLALLKVNAHRLPVMPMGTSSDLMHGETVIAIGNAFGYEHTITCGIISQLHRDVRLSAEQSYRDLIQTDASINPGNSGGPLINADGEMIGLNVAIRAGAQGIGFAIPVDEVKRVAAKLLSVRLHNNTWHGIIYDGQPVGPGQGDRVVVLRTEPSSPADAAGIRPGDQILEIGGRKVDFAHDVERALLDKRPQDRVALLVGREGREQEVQLVVRSARPGQEDAAETIQRRIGVRLAESTVDASRLRRASSQLRGGLEVVEVAPGGPAAKAGILPGDVLVGLQQWETLSVDNVVYVLGRQSRADAEPMRFYVVRSGQIHRGLLSPSRED